MSNLLEKLERDKALLVKAVEHALAYEKKKPNVNDKARLSLMMRLQSTLEQTKD